MSRLLRAELRRVTSTPMTWWLLLGTVAIGALGTLAPLIAYDGPTAGLLGDLQIRVALHGAATGSILILIAGIVGMAGEWRFGQAGQSFLTTPRRWRVVIAKAGVHLGLGVVFGVAAAVASTATAWAWYRAEGVALPLDRSSVWLTLLGCVAVAAAFAVLGVGIGAIARRQVAAIVGTLAWLVLVEPALFGAAPTVFRWLPGVASLSLRRQPADDLLPVGAAAAVLLGTVAVAMIVGIRQVERSDVTS